MGCSVWGLDSIEDLFDTTLQAESVNRLGYVVYLRLKRDTPNLLNLELRKSDGQPN